MAFNPKAGWWTALTITGLTVAVIATFAPVRHGGFAGWDDGNNIFLNARMGGLSWERVVWAFSDLGTARRYIPVGWLGFSAVFSAQGLAPSGYHVASLAWHALAALALFAATRNILRRGADPGSPGWINWLAALAAAAWALHPMRVEAVALASALLYTQASALALLALWLWTLRWDAPQKSGWLAAGSCAALAASLLTYPIALGLPAVCWLLDLAAAKSLPGLPPPRRGLARFGVSRGVLGLALVAGVVLAATLLARRANSAEFASTVSLASFGVKERGLQALYVWGRYLVQLACPTGLSPFYTELYSFDPPARSVLLTALLGVLVLGGAAWLAWRRRVSFGPVVAYSVMALPVLGLLEHPWIAHDRYAMLLHPVWCVAGAWCLLPVKAGRLRLALSVVLLGLVALGAVSAHTLAGVWRDQWSLDARLRQTLPRTAWAGYYLGSIPARVLFLEGRFSEISPWLDRAEANSPGWSAGPVRAELDWLVRQHQEHLRQNWPGRELAPLAVLHFLHGKSAQARQDWSTARAHFQAALGPAADFGEAWEEVAWCELQLHDPAAAAAAMEQALVLLRSSVADAREMQFWAALAAVHRARGDTRRADEISARAQQRLAPSAGK